MSTLEILYFAHVRERVGHQRETLELPDGATVADAVSALTQRHPTLFELLPHLRIALDGEFVSLDAPLPARGELVLIPPVAGGADSPPGAPTPGAPGAPPLPAVWLDAAPLDAAHLAALTLSVSGPDRGALVTFEGRVRDHARGQSVTALEYEAYHPMALAQMARIIAEVEREHPGVRCALHHRTGQIPIGENAVIAVASHAHRAPAFAACQRLIERLKQDVPIWKRETGDNGTVWVTERP